MNSYNNNENHNNEVTTSQVKRNGEFLSTNNGSSPNFLSQSQQEEVQLFNNCDTNNTKQNIFCEKELNIILVNNNMDNNLTKGSNENEFVKNDKCNLNLKNEELVLDSNGIKYQNPHTQQQNKTPQRNFYISLAKESPDRLLNFDADSDSTTYGTINCVDTDICRDSSDTESYSSFVTDGIATIDVLEYEVESSSSPNQLYSAEDSSSGTDEFVLNSALTARVYAKDILEFKSSKFQYWSSEFADTEDEASSSSSYDYELGKDDYWSCVKCKNTSNNPKCRYCEKCYQIRKSHFPPRPKKYRSRQQKRKRKIDHFVEEDSISLKSNEEDGIPPASKQMKRRSGEVVRFNKHTLNSAAETNSSSNSSDDEDIIKSSNSSLSSSKRFKRHSSSTGRLTKTNSGLDNFIKSDRVSINNSISNESTKNPNCRKRRLSSNNGSNNFNSSNIKKSCDNNIYDSETDLYRLKLASHLLRDSGISSAPSSQELPGTSSGTSISSADEQYKLSNYLRENKKLLEIKNKLDRKNVLQAKHLSDGTVSDEFEEHELLELQKNNNRADSDSLIVKSCNDNFEATKISLTLPTASSSNVNSLNRYFSEIPTTKRAATNDDEESLSFRATSSAIDNFNFNTVTLNKFDVLRKIEQPISSNSQEDSCLICFSASKNCVFAHSKYVCSFCCYKCAKRIWSKNGRCPICNCAVRNIMKLFVH